MKDFAQTADAVAATTRKTEKVRLLAEYLRGRRVEEAAVAALFFSGRVFPAYSESTLQVGGAMLWAAIRDVGETTDVALTAAYRRYGDLGAAAEEVLGRGGTRGASENRGPGASLRGGLDDAIGNSGDGGGLRVVEVAEEFRRIAEMRRAGMKASMVAGLLERATPRQAKYLVKLMAGELRIGLRESLVEEAIAAAYGAETKPVQRANMLLGDIGETLRLAAEGRLGEARMRLFHPIGFMLASPAENAVEAFAEFEHAVVEDKYDGIRAQAHCGRGPDGKARVRLFSRTLDDVTESFPELVPALGGFSGEVILDGEIVAWESAGAVAHESGRALPFSQLQKRLGRKRVTRETMRAVPVAYVCFDVLYAEGELVIDRPLRERAALLDAAFAAAREVERIETSDPQGQLVFEAAVEGDGFAGREATADPSRSSTARDDNRGNREEVGNPHASFASVGHEPDGVPQRLKPLGEGDTAGLKACATRDAGEGACGTRDAGEGACATRDAGEGACGTRDAGEGACGTRDAGEGHSLVVRAPAVRADSAEQLDTLFASAQARGNEGLMIKDVESRYTPGRRGKSWLKLKRALATLDVVVTAVEWGHGKRAQVLSDYTFAVRDEGAPEGPRTGGGERLLNVGKAYSGLTDAEIAEMTEWFREHTVEDHGFWRTVEAKIVIEVAFNAVMESDRHNSGYALRFPRILRIRSDKSAEEIDTLARVREIFERQRMS